MTVFISWSGPRSKAIAHVFKKHLEYVIQGLPTFMSDKDIASGTQWFQEINDKLHEATFGIVCATPENLERPWLSFEAGALANQAERSRVVPVVFGMNKDNLPAPLNGFNGVDLDEDGFLRLIESIHEALKITTKWPIVKASAHRLWPEIEADLEAIPAPSDAEAPAPGFDMEDAVKEMRGLLRDLVGRKDGALPESDPSWRAWNERTYLDRRPSQTKVLPSAFGRPSAGLIGQINGLLHAYVNGDESARAGLLELGIDPDERSPIHDLAAAQRAASSVEHDRAHSD
jgi:hypothetical protein